MTRITLLFTFIIYCKGVIKSSMNPKFPIYMTYKFLANETLKAVSGDGNLATDVVYLTKNYLVSGSLIGLKEQIAVARVRHLNLATILNAGELGVIGIHRGYSHGIHRQYPRLSLFNKDLSLEAQNVQFDRYIEIDWLKVKMDIAFFYNNTLNFLVLGKYEIFLVKIMKSEKEPSSYGARVIKTMDWTCGVEGEPKSPNYSVQKSHFCTIGIASCVGEKIAYFDTTNLNLMSTPFYSTGITSEMTQAGMHEEWTLVIENYNRSYPYLRIGIGIYTYNNFQRSVFKAEDFLLESSYHKIMRVYGITKTKFAMMYSIKSFSGADDEQQYRMNLEFIDIAESGTLSILSDYSITLETEFSLKADYPVELLYTPDMMRILQLQLGTQSYTVIRSPDKLKDLALVCFDNKVYNKRYTTRCNQCTDGYKGSCLSCQPPYHLFDGECLTCKEKNMAYHPFRGCFCPTSCEECFNVKFEGDSDLKGSINYIDMTRESIHLFCSKCIKGFEVNKFGQCQEICDPITNTYVDKLLSCKLCEEKHCKTCQDYTGKCIKCEEGYVLKDELCQIASVQPIDVPSIKEDSNSQLPRIYYFWLILFVIGCGGIILIFVAFGFQIILRNERKTKRRAHREKKKKKIKTERKSLLLERQEILLEGFNFNDSLQWEPEKLLLEGLQAHSIVESDSRDIYTPDQSMEDLNLNLLQYLDMIDSRDRVGNENEDSRHQTNSQQETSIQVSRLTVTNLLEQNIQSVVASAKSSGLRVENSDPTGATRRIIPSSLLGSSGLSDKEVQRVQTLSLE